MDQGKRYINYSPDVAVVVPRNWVAFLGGPPYAMTGPVHAHESVTGDPHRRLEFKVVRNESLYRVFLRLPIAYITSPTVSFIC